MSVEILYFEGCPHVDEARELVERVAGDVDVQLVPVPDVEAAERMHFLGSPSIRVDGRDVEPGAEERGFAFGCRVYANGEGVPAEQLVRDALR